MERAQTLRSIKRALEDRRHSSGGASAECRQSIEGAEREPTRRCGRGRSSHRACPEPEEHRKRAGGLPTKQLNVPAGGRQAPG